MGRFCQSLRARALLADEGPRILEETIEMFGGSLLFPGCTSFSGEGRSFQGNPRRRLVAQVEPADPFPNVAKNKNLQRFFCENEARRGGAPGGNSAPWARGEENGCFGGRPRNPQAQFPPATKRDSAILAAACSASFLLRPLPLPLISSFTSTITSNCFWWSGPVSRVTL